MARQPRNKAIVPLQLTLPGLENSRDPVSMSVHEDAHNRLSFYNFRELYLRWAEEEIDNRNHFRSPRGNPIDLWLNGSKD